MTHETTQAHAEPSAADPLGSLTKRHLEILNHTVHRAASVLSDAGFRVVPPAVLRLQLLRPSDVGEILGVGQRRAREIMLFLPGTVRLPGNDLRARPVELEKWIESHEVKRA